MKISKFSLFFVLFPLTLHAETGYDMWLRYAALDEAASRQYRAALPGVVTILGDNPVERSGQEELTRGIRGMLGRTLRVEARLPNESALVLGTLDEFRRAAPQLGIAANLSADGYLLKTVRANGTRHIVIAATNDRGVLYGVFSLLRKIALGEPIAELSDQQSPATSIRWIN